MRKILIVAGLCGSLLLTGCAVNVVTVNVTGSEVGYTDAATSLSSDVVESNVE